MERGTAQSSISSLSFTEFLFGEVIARANAQVQCFEDLCACVPCIGVHIVYDTSVRDQCVQQKWMKQIGNKLDEACLN